MARWDEDGRRGEEGSRRGDEWRGDDRHADRGPSGRERWGDDRETWRGGEERAESRERRGGAGYGRMPATDASGHDPLAYRGPYRRSGDHGTGARGGHDQRVGSRWGGGDYTTYGQSGFEESERAAWMNEDLHREQGGGWRSHQHGGGMERVRARGPKGYRRSDERIRDEICERIARSGIDADEVEVRVEGGEVTLTGTAEDRHDKRMLEDLAYEVFGVEEVQNHLRLDRASRDEGAGAATTATGAGQGTQAEQGGQRPRQPPPHAGARH